MSKRAAQLAGAVLEQARASSPPAPLGPQGVSAPAAGPDARIEAERLAQLAGAFSLFGLCIEPPRGWDHAFFAGDPAKPRPANDDGAPAFAFPELRRRGVHLDPALPVRLIRAIDWVIVAVAAEFAALWGAGASLAELSIGQAIAFLLSAGSIKAGLWLTEFYRISPGRIRPDHGFGGLAFGAVLGLVIANALAPDARSTAALAATLPVTALLLAGLHAAFAVWVAAAHRAGVFSETVVLVGATEAAKRLAARAAKNGEARVVAVVDDRLARAPREIAGAPVAGTLNDLLAWPGLPHVDRIVIAVTAKAEARVRGIIERLRAVPNRVDLLLDYEAKTVRGRRFERLSGAAVACVSGRPRNHRRALVKRVQDLVLGALLLAVFALPMLAIALAVRLDSRGPALFRQQRHGFNNRVFTVLKFRTMRHEPGAPLRQACPDDPRVTRLGKLLRRTSLDELPQLFNVLAGDMSLVGPRPHAIGMKAAERELHHIVAEYAHRHRVKPGVTGLAQVSGSRGPLATAADVRRRLRLDLDYVSRASLWLDLQILLRTAPMILGDRRATR
jgi:exopolysaccharide biosynthesis polyprenyl glycosylphosphotransferase